MFKSKDFDITKLSSQELVTMLNGTNVSSSIGECPSQVFIVRELLKRGEKPCLVYNYEVIEIVAVLDILKLKP